MHRLAQAAFLSVALVAPAIAQNDIAAVDVPAPLSGCALTSTENVSVRLFNYGSTLPAGTSFTASYSINAAAPTTELITLGASLLSNSGLLYTFTTQADLSASGSYTFDVAVSLPGDVNPQNDSQAGVVVTNYAPSSGGTVGGSAGPTLTGSVVLSGHTGSVLAWQESDDGGLRWRELANDSTTQAFDQLREHTAFRALVQNGPCAPALSGTHFVLSSDPIFYSGFEP